MYKMHLKKTGIAVPVFFALIICVNFYKLRNNIKKLIPNINSINPTFFA